MKTTIESMKTIISEKVNFFNCFNLKRIKLYKIIIILTKLWGFIKFKVNNHI